jgi:hypothetical protein
VGTCVSAIRNLRPLQLRLLTPTLTPHTARNTATTTTNCHTRTANHDERTHGANGHNIKPPHNTRLQISLNDHTTTHSAVECQWLTRHADEVKTYLRLQSVDITLICETHFTMRISIRIPSYSIYSTLMVQRMGVNRSGPSFPTSGSLSLSLSLFTLSGYLPFLSPGSWSP